MSAAGWVVVAHGGAGRVPAAADDAEFARTARAGIEQALAAAARTLEAGGGALDAAVAAVVVLEDCPVFNAGLGSVCNADGEVEMDASVMEGAGRAAGGVAGLRRVAHPVEAARAVLRDGRHVLLAGAGAEHFAAQAGLEPIDPARLARAAEQWDRRRRPRREAAGTVGAVVRDAAGSLAAATSTGGTPRKRPGRVSDSALPGSGTWADDATCAVSATGHGEMFVRTAFAHEVDAGMRHAGLALDAACARALELVAVLGGSGGAIAVDRGGSVSLRFDTEGMPRGVLRAGAAPRVAVHPGEEL